MRRWCQEHHIGRLVVNRWRVSRVALLMLLEGNGPALAAYLAGDRASEMVTAYYLRSGIPLRTLRGPNV
ncbi:hypothetical protein P7L87_27505 [Vibrio parahaemolyticus]|nr:hypothetical protein [Vibrio parahaemolyticus]